MPRRRDRAATSGIRTRSARRPGCAVVVVADRVAQRLGLPVEVPLVDDRSDRLTMTLVSRRTLPTRARRPLRRDSPPAHARAGAVRWFSHQLAALAAEVGALG